LRVEEEQIDVPCRTLGQALCHEGSAAGDGEAGALRKADKQTGGLNLKWR